jgi:hypothetical protein
MASGKDLARKPAVRALLMGYPGTGKTGALASLANAGFKLRIIDFDGNPESLLQYTDRSRLGNIDIVSCEDNLGDLGQYVGPKGIPSAFTQALRTLIRWKYEDPSGDVVDEKTGKHYVDLGPTSEWGPDTVVVLDGLTGQGKAAFRRAQAMLNKTPLNTTQQVWGAAMADQEAMIEILTRASNRYHVVCISHLKIIGPKADANADSSLVKDIKEAQAELVKTKLMPSALGWALPQSIAGHFPVVACAEVRVKGKNASRVLTASAREDMDLKLPAKGDFGDLPLATGLLDIFKALGANPPE